MDQLRLAILGQAVTIAAADLFLNYEDNFTGFASEADLITWCNTFGLQFDFDADTNQYKIFTP